MDVLSSNKQTKLFKGDMVMTPLLAPDSFFPTVFLSTNHSCLNILSILAFSMSEEAFLISSRLHVLSYCGSFIFLFFLFVFNRLTKIYAYRLFTYGI